MSMKEKMEEANSVAQGRRSSTHFFRHDTLHLIWLANFCQYLLYCISMATINISIPDSLKKFLDEQVKKHDYSTVSEYFRDLLRAAKRRATNEHIDALLIEGLESGPASPLTEADWEKLHAELDAYIAKKKK